MKGSAANAPAAERTTLFKIFFSFSEILFFSVRLRQLQNWLEHSPLCNNKSLKGSFYFV